MKIDGVCGLEMAQMHCLLAARLLAKRFLCFLPSLMVLKNGSRCATTDEGDPAEAPSLSRLCPCLGLGCEKRRCAEGAPGDWPDSAPSTSQSGSPRAGHGSFVVGWHRLALDTFLIIKT